MNRLVGTLALGCFILVGCRKDSARLVKDAAPPTLATQPDAAGPASSGSAPKARPRICPPLDVMKGNSTFTASGACSFEHRGPVDCKARGDEFIFSENWGTEHGLTAALHGSVEHYHGAGKYEHVQILVRASDPTPLRGWWRSEALTVTVGAGEKYVDLAPTKLLSPSPQGATTLDISGRLWCRPKKAAPTK